MMKKATMIAMAILLAGCFDVDTAGTAVLSPGDDPLVNHLYKHLLDESGVEYSINDEGYYVSDESNLVKMEAIATKTHEQLRNTREIKLNNTCVVENVKKKLKGAVFVIETSGNGPVLRMASSAFDTEQVPEKITRAEAECSQLH